MILQQSLFMVVLLVLVPRIIAKELLRSKIEGKRRRGRPRKMWLDNIKDWIRLSVDDLQGQVSLWKTVVAEAYVIVHSNDHLGQVIVLNV